MNRVLIIVLLFINSTFSFGQEVKIYTVGEFAQGGIVFWLDETGQHGLVCAKLDQGSNIQWDKEIDFNDVPNGGAYPPEKNTKSVAIADGIYSGKENTKAIIEFVGVKDKTYAAIICDELSLMEDSVVYNDWYLPSREELNWMYINRTLINETALKKGGDSLNKKRYWSSTDVNCNEKPHSLMDKVHAAWGHNFSLGSKKYQLACRKYMPYSVRAIRSF